MKNNTAPEQSQQYTMASDEAFAALVGALRHDDAEDPEPLSCAECRAQLPALYHLQGAAEPLPTSTAAACAHLASCPACAAEYAALEDVLGELASGSLADLETEPAFDLSFLRRPHVQGPALWRVLGDSAWRLYTDLQVSLREAGVSFGLLPASLAATPVPVCAGVFRADTPAGRLELLMLPAPDADISIQLGVGSQVGDYAAVIVKILSVPSGKPLGDLRVTLRNAQHQLLTGLVTRPDGTAVFERLPLGRYFVQVRYGQDSWEIPLIIVAGSSPA